MIAWMLAALVGCGGGSPDGAVPGSPPASSPRLVSLSPAITSTLGALDALDPLVGRSDWCDHPQEAMSRPTMGSALSPRFEAIARAQPTHVLVGGSAAAKVESLRAMAPVVVLPWLTVDEVAGSVRVLGDLIDRKAKAETLAHRLETTLGVPPPETGPRVLLSLTPEADAGGEIWYVKRNSLHGAALHAAGGRNAIDDDVSGAPVLSIEALVALDPSRVIVLSNTALDADAEAAVLASWSALTPLRAVREGRVAVVHGPGTLAPGPRVLDLVPRLRDALAQVDAE